MYLINKTIIKNYNFEKNIKFFFSNKDSYIYIKGLYNIFVLKLYKYYYYIIKDKNIILLYNNKNKFLSFIKNLILLYNKITLIYTVRLKLRGLGFKIRKVSKNLYYLFFNYINMYYIYIPKNLLIK
jgi:hypothetical protein